jgi:hypothetical protein
MTSADTLEYEARIEDLHLFGPWTSVRCCIAL